MKDKSPKAPTQIATNSQPQHSAPQTARKDTAKQVKAISLENIAVMTTDVVYKQTNGGSCGDAKRNEVRKQSFV